MSPPDETADLAGADLRAYYLAKGFIRTPSPPVAFDWEAHGERVLRLEGSDAERAANAHRVNVDWAVR